MATSWTTTWRPSGTTRDNDSIRTFTPTNPQLLSNYRRIESITRKDGVWCNVGRDRYQSVAMRGYDELINASTGTVIMKSTEGECRCYGTGPSSTDYITTYFTNISAQQSYAIVSAWKAGVLQIKRTVWITAYTDSTHGTPTFRDGYYHDDITISGTDSSYMPEISIASFSANNEDRLYASTWSSPPFDFTVNTTISNSTYWESTSSLYRRLTVSVTNLTSGISAMSNFVVGTSSTSSTSWTVTQASGAFYKTSDGFLRGSRYRVDFIFEVGINSSSLSESAIASKEIDMATIPFHMSRLGNGVAIGKYSAAGSNINTKLFECEYPAIFYDKVQFLGGVQGSQEILSSMGLQAGQTEEQRIANDSSGTFTITFPKAYSTPPIVVLSKVGAISGSYAGRLGVAVTNITTTGCTVLASNGGSGAAWTFSVMWIAFGTLA